MPSFSAMSCWSVCEEWPASTLSQNVACVMSVTGFMDIGWLSAKAPAVRARLMAPWPRTADIKTPFPSASVWFSPASEARGAESSMGRLGQPRMPTLTSPSTIKARQTAYCPPRRKPLVPSIGSKAQILPDLPPELLPLSMASNISSSPLIGPPKSSSDAASVKRDSWTREKIWDRKAVLERRELASSSPTTESEGKFACMAAIIRA